MPGFIKTSGAEFVAAKLSNQPLAEIKKVAAWLRQNPNGWSEAPWRYKTHYMLVSYNELKFQSTLTF